MYLYVIVLFKIVLRLSNAFSSVSAFIKLTIIILKKNNSFYKYYGSMI